jgi:hypothetical protein
MVETDDKQVAVHAYPAHGVGQFEKAFLQTKFRPFGEAAGRHAG